MKDNTLVEIKRFDFFSFDDTTLGWTCIEPTIQKIRGKNLILKSQVYNQLTTGQQSLLMFWILYGHARNGIIQFFDEVDYLLSKTEIWLEFNEKFRNFEDKDLLRLIKEIERSYDCYIKAKNDIGSEFQVNINKLNIRYNEIVQNSLIQVGKYIRNNPDEFVCFID